MDPKTYPEWQASLLKHLVATTKAVSAVGRHDITFECSIDPEFDSSLTTVTDGLLSLSNRLLKFAGLQEDEFENEDDIEDRWGDVVDVLDSLLERAVTFHFMEEKIYFRILVWMNFLEQQLKEMKPQRLWLHG